MSVPRDADSVTAAAVHAPVPPPTAGAVGAAVSTRHVNVAVRLVEPIAAFTVKVCRPSLSAL